MTEPSRDSAAPHRHLVAPVETLPVRAVRRLEPQLPADVGHRGSAKGRTSRRSASGAQVALASEKATISELGLAHRAVLRRDLAAARVADHARAGRLGELVGAVGRGVGGDDDLEPVARIVEREQVRDAALDQQIPTGQRRRQRDQPLSSAARGLAPYSMNKERNRNNERQAFD